MTRTSDLRLLPAAAAAATLFFSANAHATVPVGPEFEVSTDASDNPFIRSQRVPAAASMPNGTTVVVWHDDGFSFEGSPTGTTSIAGRIYGPGGVAQSAPFTVVSPYQVENPIDGELAVAINPKGNFVVVWVLNPRDDEPIIFARWFSSVTQQPLGDAIFVNLDNGFPLNVTVAADADGGFAIAWENTLYHNGVPRQTVLTRRYDAAGQALTGATLVRVTSEILEDPSIAMDAAGHSVIAWKQTVPGATTSRVYGRRFDSSGGPAALPFLASGTANAAQPAVAMDVDGDYVIAFTRDAGIVARRYAASGVASSGITTVSLPTTLGSFDPVVAMDAVGDYVITWSSYDGSNQGVFGRAFKADGTRRGGQFRVNEVTTADQVPRAVAMDADGDFTVVWLSYADTIPHALTDSDVEARRFRAFSSADLTLAMKGTTHVVPGGQIAYKLQVANASPVSGATGNAAYDGSIHVASNVRVVQQFPAGTTFTSVQQTGTSWDCATAGSRLTCTYDRLLFSRTTPPFLSVKVKAPADATGVLTSTATVSADQGDPLPLNGEGQVSTTVE